MAINLDMLRYMRGLLMTQIFWSNHAASMRFYLNKFLIGNAAGYDLLEIGPGHGLLFSRAIADTRSGSVGGWGFSVASVAATREALDKLKVTRPYRLEVRDLFESNECVEAYKALAAIRGVMRPRGRLYINVPINSPVPDHLLLLRFPDEALSFVKSHGL